MCGRSACELVFRAPLSRPMPASTISTCLVGCAIPTRCFRHQAGPPAAHRPGRGILLLCVATQRVVAALADGSKLPPWVTPRETCTLAVNPAIVHKSNQTVIFYDALRLQMFPRAACVSRFLAKIKAWGG